MTVCLEMGGPDVVRPIVEAAGVQHPSLVDSAHRMDALFGVDNIPQNVWIDEEGASSARRNPALRHPRRPTTRWPSWRSPS